MKNQFKICLSCGEKNNPSFSNCWKCGCLIDTSRFSDEQEKRSKALAILNYSYIQQGKGRHKEALEGVKNALAIDPDLAYANVVLAEFLMKGENWIESKKYFEMGIELLQKEEEKIVLRNMTATKEEVEAAACCFLGYVYVKLAHLSNQNSQFDEERKYLTKAQLNLKKGISLGAKKEARELAEGLLKKFKFDLTSSDSSRAGTNSIKNRSAENAAKAAERWMRRIREVTTNSIKNRSAENAASSSLTLGMQSLKKEEQIFLRKFLAETEAGEMAQAQELIGKCNITFQFAKTHSNYVKDWEKNKAKMEKCLAANKLPPDTSRELMEAMIEELDKIYQKKFKLVQDGFEEKFGESILNYLGSDGKTKNAWTFWGIIIVIIIGAALYFYPR